MKYRTMGKLGIQTSVFGLGCMRFNGAASGDSVIDEQKAISLIRRAIDGGDAPKKVTVRGGKSTSRNRSIKYVCPACGTIIRAARQVNVKCGDCDVAFEAQ